ncbi:MAG: 50S ribosomal protein L11 methyltransferase [Chloroflexi bacterium]|nr:50S ribosomal protein L11 methyltransferase [Chloroflexota bacterium]
MKWLELSIQAPPEYVEPLSQIFHRYGQGGVAIEETGGFNLEEDEGFQIPGQITLRTYLPLNPAAKEKINRIELGVRLVSLVCELPALEQRVIEEEDWANSWKKHIQIIHIGRGMVLQPTWLEYHPQEGEVVIHLDPGMAFGTGHHPTTRMCLVEMEELLKPGMRVLDVGTGSGILSIAAAKLGAERVVALDIDPTSVKVALDNVKRNGVHRVVEVLQGSLPHPDVKAGTFDLAVANISSKVILQMADSLKSALRPAGLLIASGFILEKEKSLQERLVETGFKGFKIIYDDDWVTIVASLRNKIS